MTLRELLLFNSLYLSKTLSDIVDLVNDQPNPQVFYKSFMEFDNTNMVSILSFDSRSMEYLLQDDFSDHFDKQYPIFYRNKIPKGPTKDGKYFYRSAIDNALKNNQVKAVSLIISYIVKYQNNFSSSYLFNKNFANLFEKGIQIKELLDSQVFSFDFDFDEWPSTHNNDETFIRPYNESIYSIMRHYKTVFPEEEFDDIVNPDGSVKQGIETDKIYKIKYTINLLPTLGSHVVMSKDDGEKNFVNDDYSFLKECAEGDELEMFESQSIQDMIEFKWSQFGQSHHLMFCIMHFLQLGILMFYIVFVYYNNKLAHEDGSDTTANPYAWIMLAGIVVPVCYESIQMIKIGFIEYITVPANYINLTYIICSIAMSFTHALMKGEEVMEDGTTKTIIGPMLFGPKVIMIFVLALSIIRTFKFMRIFKDFSPIVTMLSSVFVDLKQFLFIYIVLLGLFSMVMGILQLGNTVTGEYAVEIHGAGQDA